MEKKQNSKNKFDLLPEAIRDWLTSFDVTNHIVSLNDAYKISWEKRRVIPKNIARLTVGLLSPSDFLSTIKTELGVEDSRASQITHQVAVKILHPIQDALKTTQNIDVSPLFKIAQSQTKPTKTQVETPKSDPARPTPAALGTNQKPAQIDSLASLAKKEEAKESLSQEKPKKPMSAFASMRQGSLAQEAREQQQIKSQQINSAQKPVRDTELPEKNFTAIKTQEQKTPDSKQKVQETQQPFMLHEETPKAPTESSGSSVDFSFELPKSTGRPEKPKTKVSFGNFFKRSTKEKAGQSAPKVESKKEIPKVVHYSAFRTMLGDEPPNKQNS